MQILAPYTKVIKDEPEAAPAPAPEAAAAPAKRAPMRLRKAAAPGGDDAPM